MRKNKNYYSPSAYDVYRNAEKARKNSIEDTGENIDNIDILVMEINKENKRHNKSQKPNVPLNAKKEPKAINIKKEHRSVYDEIAERREKEKLNNSLSKASQPTEKTYFNNVAEPKKVEDTLNNEIFSHSQNFEYGESDSDFDVIQEYETKAKTHTKLWVALIIVLSILCLGLVGLYAYQQGLFDVLLKYFGF
ncbi:MAG: hypothetical protein ACI4HO_01490 [Ruminococcus sp.]